MIRAMVLGLGLAGVTCVQSGSLSALMGDRLPDWTQAIANDLSAFRGSGVLAGPLALTVARRLFRIDRGGPVWLLHVSGPGVRLSGDLTLASDGTTHLRAFSGAVDPAALAIWEQSPEFDTRLQITRASATLDPHAGTLSTFQAEGSADDVLLGQSAFGSAHAAGRWPLVSAPDTRGQSGRGRSKRRCAWWHFTAPCRSRPGGDAANRLGHAAAVGRRLADGQPSASAAPLSMTRLAAQTRPFRAGSAGIRCLNARPRETPDAGNGRR